MDIYIIKNVHTGEVYKTPRGRSSWTKPGSAKTAFTGQEKYNSHRRGGRYPGLDTFDSQSDWIVEKVNHSSPIDNKIFTNTKETLDHLIFMLKRDGIYVHDFEYYEVINNYESEQT